MSHPRSTTSMLMLACMIGTASDWAGAQVQRSAATSLEPDPLVRAAVQGNPLVGAARTEVSAAESDVASARAQYWPTASGTVEARDNGIASQAILNQPLWTFGRVKHDVLRAKALMRAADSGTAQSQHEIALRTINAWESFAAASARDAVSRVHLQELGQFQAMMQRRVRAGVSANIDQDLVDSRILQSQVQLEGADSSRQLALGRLEQLTGLDLPEQARLAPEALDRLAREYTVNGDPIDSHRAELAKHPSVVRAGHLVEAAEETVKLRRAQRWPTIAARYSKEFGPAAIKERDGLSIALQYQFGAGTALYDARAADARAEGQRFQQEAALRLVTESAQAEWQNFLSARNRARSLEAALSGAQAVKASYARQFIAGRKSWLDVLNAVREVEQNELMIADAQANMVASAYRLRLYLGQLPWQHGWTKEGAK